MTLAALAAAYGMSVSALERHKANHLRVSPGLVSEAKNALQVVAYASDLYQRASRIADKAEQLLDNVAPGDMPSRSVQAAGAALRELRGSIDLLAKLVVSAPPEDKGTENTWLDAAITEAVQGLRMAELPAGSDGITDAVIVHAPE